jgi:hypothetical protein
MKELLASSDAQQRAVLLGAGDGLQFRAAVLGPAEVAAVGQARVADAGQREAFARARRRGRGPAAVATARAVLVEAAVGVAPASPIRVRRAPCVSA